MRLGNRMIMGWVVLLAGILAVPSVGLAQDTTTGDNTNLRTPRNNVKGGSLATNRPGVTIGKSIASSVTRNQEMILQWGGATYQGPEQYPPSRREVFMVTFFEDMFSILTDMVQQIQLALEAAQALSATSS